MDTIDRSLHGLMRINRYRFINSQTPIVTDPIVTEPTGYVLADFGENAINNHNSSDASHSEAIQTMFNYITRDFRDRCTSFQTYNNTFLGNGALNKSNVLSKASAIDADIIFTPYVGAANWMNGNYYNFLISVASHYDNDGQEDIQVGTDNNRHDITANATTFLSDSIAVSARRDTPELFKNSTSEGYGMEFFEDCSPEALDPFYPDKDIPAAFVELITTDGINITSNVHLIFTSYVAVGEKITVRYSSDNWVDTYITSIIDANHMTVSPAITPIITTGIYAWHDITLGNLVSQQESCAVPLIAGKLKVIKMTTNSDWETVRMAARATAKRNTTGIEEIDNVSWDIYRGFGCIQVQDAIDYINN